MLILILVRSAPSSPTHGMSMNPSLKQQPQTITSRTESFSEDEQKVFQQNNNTNISSHGNTDGSLLVTDPSEISAMSMSNRTNEPLTPGSHLPSLQSFKPSANTFKGGVSPIIAGQPGAHSVFFTSAKLVPQPIYGQTIKSNSAATVTSQTFMVPQNTLKPLDKKVPIRPNGGTPLQPPTILFRSSGTGQPISINQGNNHTIKTVTPILTNGQVISTHGNLLFTQTLVKTNPSKIVEQKFAAAPPSLIAASSDILATVGSTSASSLQTVSVIKQPPLHDNLNEIKDSKPFTSITDILSTKDVKQTANGGDEGITFFCLF